MSEPNAIKPLIDQLTVMIKEGYDFGKGQMPEIGRQLLRFYLLENSLYFIGCLLFSGLSGYFSFKVYRMVIADHSDMDGRWILLSGLGIVSAVFVLVAGQFISEIFKIWIAPKVFLLDCLHGYL